MSDNPEDYSLYHYGVKGMRWGKTTKKTGAERSADRKKIYNEVKNKSTGKESMKRDTAVGIATGGAAIVLGAPMALAMVNATVGYKIAKSAGYSRGKSAAIGLIGGTPGGVIAAEIAVRRNEID